MIEVIDTSTIAVKLCDDRVRVPLILTEFRNVKRDESLLIREGP